MSLALSTIAGNIANMYPGPSAQYANFRAAMARTAAGTGYTKIALVGDSTTMGAYAGGSAVGIAGNRSISPTVLLKNALQPLVTAPVIANGWFGDQSTTITNGSTPFLYDTRLSQPDGANWAGASTRTAGGSVIASNNTFRFGFLPTDGLVDTFEISYPTNTGLGSFSATRNGTAAQTVSQSTTAGIGKLTYVSTGTAPTDALYIAGTSGTAYISSVHSYSSTVKSISIMNIGWSGGLCSDWISTTNAFAPLFALKALAADLYLIRPAINEWNTGVAVATFQTNLATLVDALLTVGNVALATPYPSQATTVSLAVQATYVAAIFAVANARNLRVDDMWTGFGSWENANALGYYANNLHPQQAGYQAAMMSHAPFIMSL